MQASTERRRWPWEPSPTATVARTALPASRSSRLTPELRSECTASAGAPARHRPPLLDRRVPLPPGSLASLVRHPPEKGQNSLGGRASGRAVQSSWLGRSLSRDRASPSRIRVPTSLEQY